MAIGDFAESLVQGIVESCRRFATYSYERRLEDRELYPIFLIPEPIADEATVLIERHRKALFGIVAGEEHYDRLSPRILAREQLKNLGYFGNDLILVHRFGAVLSGFEAETNAELLSLVLAQYWSMRSYDFVLDHEINNAQQQLEELPKYYQFWRMLGRYHHFSTEAIDFAKDKLSSRGPKRGDECRAAASSTPRAQSLHTVVGGENQIESDWSLRELYEEARKAFGLDALSNRVEAKLAKIDSAYNVAREQLSANVYILLDIIFLSFLIWSIVDTLLLARIAFR